MQLMEIVINYLVRLALQFNASTQTESQSREHIALSATAVELLRQALVLVPEVNITFKSFEVR